MSGSEKLSISYTPGEQTDRWKVINAVTSVLAALGAREVSVDVTIPLPKKTKPPLVKNITPARLIEFEQTATGTPAQYATIYGEKFAVTDWQVGNPSAIVRMECQLRLRQVMSGPASHPGNGFHLDGERFTFGGLEWVVTNDVWHFSIGGNVELEINAQLAVVPVEPKMTQTIFTQGIIP